MNRKGNNSLGDSHFSITICWCILVCTGTLLALDQTAANTLAQSLISQTGRAKGVASVARCNNGTLATALVNYSGLMVHAMDGEAANVSATRTLGMNTTAEIGRRMYVEKGGTTTLPYASNYVDLLVIANLRDADLASVSFDEIRRCLNPGGRAFVGRASADGAGITATALQTWISGKPEASIVTDAQGTWAILTKGKLPGSDVWTHAVHGPDNNPVSNDSLIKWPFLTQWRQKPLTMNRNGAVVTSNGRTYMGLCQSAYSVRAYRSQNGQLLWNKTLRQAGSPGGASSLIATDAGVYTVQNSKIVLLSGETGTDAATITVETNTARKVKWMALSGNLLYTLSGDSIADTSYYRYGDAISAYNTATQQQAWRKTYTGRIDSREIGIADGKVFFYIQGNRVMAINATSGDSVWAQNGSQVINLLERNTNNGWSWTTYPATGFVCSQYGVFIASPGDSAMVALSASNGSLLWTGAYSGWGRMTPFMVIGTTLANLQSKPADKTCWDIATNSASTKYTKYDFGGGCGVRTAAVDGFFGNAGGQTASFSQNRNLPNQIYKTDCGIGTILSDGLMIMPAVGCECSPIRGTIVNANAGTFTFDRVAVQAQRLEQGPAFGSVVTQIKPDDQDWWTQRGNANRTGYAPVNVSTTPRLMCAYEPPRPYDSTWDESGDRADAIPTPVVTAGNLAFWGGSDGYVRCFDISSDREVWNGATGGAINATPTVWDGCVYVGSEDGYAYCFEAHTGRLVWRFRAAPIERRINLYGHLASTWPVNSGITIVDGKVMFAVGLESMFGTHVYALDPKSGAIVWQNNSSGTLYSAADRIGVTPSGYGLSVKGKYWVRAQVGRNGIYSGTDGTIEPLPASPSLNAFGGPRLMGSEIGRLDSTHVIYGGRWAYMAQTDRGFSDRRRTFVGQSIDAQGRPLYPEVSVVINSLCAPAWDSQIFISHVANGHSGEWIEKWSMATYIRTIDSVRTAAANATKTDVTLEGRPAFAAKIATPLAQWSIMNLPANAIALARNAIVVTHADFTGADSYVQKTWKWRISILARDNVDTLWSALLPSAPVQGGLAIGRTGEMIVALRSGAILCYGTGTVSVARREQKPPPAVTAHPAASVASTTPDIITVESAPAAGNTNQAKAAPRAMLVNDESDPPAETFAGFKPACGITPDRVALAQQQESKAARALMRSMKWDGQLPCVDVASVKASSTNGVNKPVNITDRDLRTRWTPEANGSSWVACDLGQTRSISGVSMVLFAARQSVAELGIELSVDGKTFEKVDSDRLSWKGTHESMRSFLTQEARWVRLSLKPVSGDTRPCVYEMGVHETAVAGR